MSVEDVPVWVSLEGSGICNFLFRRFPNYGFLIRRFQNHRSRIRLFTFRRHHILCLCQPVSYRRITTWEPVSICTVTYITLNNENENFIRYLLHYSVLGV